MCAVCAYLRRRQACQEASRARLWAHALLLASHVDKTLYRRTVAQFATDAFPDGHPLRTFYLLLANQPDGPRAPRLSLPPPPSSSHLAACYQLAIQANRISPAVGLVHQDHTPHQPELPLPFASPMRTCVQSCSAAARRTTARRPSALALLRSRRRAQASSTTGRSPPALRRIPAPEFKSH